MSINTTTETTITRGFWRLSECDHTTGRNTTNTHDEYEIDRPADLAADLVTWLGVFDEDPVIEPGYRPGHFVASGTVEGEELTIWAQWIDNDEED